MKQQLVRDLLLKSSEMSLLCSLFLCFMPCVMCSLARLSPWYSYYIAVGNLLTNTFTHHATLLETLIFHEQICRSTYGSLWLDCRNYNAGQAVAQYVRENGTKDDFIPMVVDYEQDRMCFLRVERVEKDDFSNMVDKSCDFKVPLIGPLKWDSTVYRFFDDHLPLASIDSSLLSISFRQEMFCEEQHIPSPKIVDAFQLAFEMADSQHPKEHLNSFFWTSSHAKKYFQGPEPVVKEDQDNFFADYKRWKSIASALLPIGDQIGYHDFWNPAQTYQYHLSDRFDEEQVNYSQSLEDSLVNTGELCNLTSILAHMELNPGSLQIHINKLFAEESHERSKGCFTLLLAILAKQDYIHHIALQAKPELLNLRARSILQTASVGNSASNQIYTAAGLRGDGQIVSIADTGVDVNSCYFADAKGRVKPSTANAPNIDPSFRKVIGYITNPCGDTVDTGGGHGTHVAGTVAGNVANADIFSGDGQYDGTAPNAKIIFNDYSSKGSGLCIPGSAQLYGVGYAGGARIHTNSWGSLFQGAQYYSGADTDGYLQRNPSLAVFFAAGNFGGNGLGTSTVTIESTAKNVIAVGSGQTTLGSANISYIAWYSSKGPTYDGRFKPDIIATGDGVRSANADGSGGATCSTIEMTGTSMASPSAAGTGALVRQYFSDGSGNFWTGVCKSVYRSCKAFSPTGYLIKGILIHSAMQMSLFNGGGTFDIPLGPPPDFMQGFGRVGLLTALPLKGSPLTSFDLFVADAVNIAENSQILYTVNVERADQPLMITLTWYDPPNVQGVYTRALINDIDVKATSPSNQNVFPNGRTFPDSNNNVEKIVVHKAATGLWRVTISSRALPAGGNQLFALAITSAGTVGYN